jgi:hypothetical protein
MVGGGVGAAGWDPRRPRDQLHGQYDLLWERDYLGRLAPLGYMFNRMGELVQLPYQPNAAGPQMAWGDPQNPQYLAFAQGRMTLENQPIPDGSAPPRYGVRDATGHQPQLTEREVALVPQQAYLLQNGDEVPHQDEGTSSNAVFDSPSSPVRSRYHLSKEMLGLVQVDPPTPGSPLLVVPLGDSLITAPAIAPVAFFGGAVSLGLAQFGHKGGSTELTFDVLPGSLVKIPAVPSMMRMAGRIAPRYFANDGGTPLRQYLLFPGGPVLTQASFSNLPPNIMSLQGGGPGTIVAAGVAANPVTFSGWSGKGLSPTPDEATLPVRIFRGSVLSSAATGAPTNASRIPIPFGAIGVALFGGIFNSGLTPSTVPITWTQNLDVAGATVGPFPSDGESIIPIVQGATSIDVFGGNSAAIGDLEIPFFAYYYINV